VRGPSRLASGAQWELYWNKISEAVILSLGLSNDSHFGQKYGDSRGFWFRKRWRNGRAPLRLSLRIGCAVVFLCASVLAAVPADPEAVTTSCGPGLQLTADQIAQRLAARNVERAQHLGSFESERHYELEYTGFPSSRSATMSVNATYRAPGTKQFTVTAETGSKLILTRVLHRLLESEQESSSDEANRKATALTTANYRFALRGCDASADRDTYVMNVEPLRDNKFLYRGTIWIDAADFAVVRIDAEPAKNPSIWTKHSQIHHQYQKVGEFYLPSSNETVTEVRLGGRSVLKIRYENYRIHTSGEDHGRWSASNSK